METRVTGVGLGQFQNELLVGGRHRPLYFSQGVYQQLHPTGVEQLQLAAIPSTPCGSLHFNPLISPHPQQR